MRGNECIDTYLMSTYDLMQMLRIGFEHACEDFRSSWGGGGELYQYIEYSNANKHIIFIDLNKRHIHAIHYL